MTLAQRVELRLDQKLTHLFRGPEYGPLRQILLAIIKKSRSEDGEQLFITRNTDIKIKSLEDFDKYIQVMISRFADRRKKYNGKSLPKKYHSALERACYLAFIVHFGVKRKETNAYGYPLDYVEHVLDAAFESEAELGLEGDDQRINVFRKITTILHDTFEDWMKGKFLVPVDATLKPLAVLDAIQACINEKIQRVLDPKNTCPYNLVKGISKVTKPQGVDRLEAFLHLFLELYSIWDLIPFDTKLADGNNNSRTFLLHGKSSKSPILIREAEIRARIALTLFGKRLAYDRQNALLALYNPSVCDIANGQPKTRAGKRITPDDYILPPDFYKKWVSKIYYSLGSFLMKHGINEEHYRIKYVPRTTTYAAVSRVPSLHLGHFFVWPEAAADTITIGFDRFEALVEEFFSKFAPGPKHQSRDPLYRIKDSGNPLDKLCGDSIGRIIATPPDGLETTTPIIGFKIHPDRATHLVDVHGTPKDLGKSRSKKLASGKSDQHGPLSSEKIVESMWQLRQVAKVLLKNAKNLSTLKNKKLEQFQASEVTRNLLQLHFMDCFCLLLFPANGHITITLTNSDFNGEKIALRLPPGTNVAEILALTDFAHIHNFAAFKYNGPGTREELPANYVLKDGDNVRIKYTGPSLLKKNLSVTEYATVAKLIASILLEKYGCKAKEANQISKTLSCVYESLFPRFAGGR